MRRPVNLQCNHQMVCSGESAMAQAHSSLGRLSRLQQMHLKPVVVVVVVVQVAVCRASTSAGSFRADAALRCTEAITRAAGL